MTDTTTTKRCGRCREEKPLGEFYRRSGGRAGVQDRCKVCSRSDQLERQRRRAEQSPVVPPQEGSKMCKGCKTLRAYADYQRDRSTRDGLQSRCRSCKAATQRAYKERHADVIALRYAERLARTPSPDAAKECHKCGAVKPLTAFYAHRTAKQGRANYCIECQKAATRQWRLENAARIKAANNARTPEQRAQANRSWNLKGYGLDEDAYNSLLGEQNGVCAICLLPETAVHRRTGVLRRLAVDHDHATGRVRGLLCGRCNSALGLYDDDIDRLQSAVDYLRRAVTASGC